MNHLIQLCLLICVILGVNSDPQRHSGIDDMLSQLSRSGDVQSLSYCRISTRDLISTAQSTVNRVLHGVCNPRELDDRFKSLELKVVDQFNVLKTMVLNIEDKLRDQDHQVAKQHKRIHSILATKNQGPQRQRGRLTQPPIQLGNTTNLDNMTISEIQALGENELYYDEDQEDVFHTEEEATVSGRQGEIDQFNSTIHTQDDGSRVFTYYWQVKDIKYKMKNWGWKRSLRSQSFYVFQYGYKMYLRIFPNQEGKNIYIHVGLTKGDFDDSLEWPFKQRHNIMVIDHHMNPQDLTSRIWDPTQLCSAWNWKKPESRDNFECVGLGFYQKILLSKGYIHNGAITIKLTVFL